jgi:hemerythrin superfamily protein
MADRLGTMPETGAVALLRRQHQQIRHLFRDVEDNAGRHRVAAFERLCRLLAVHETAEEEIIHPLARRGINDDRIAALLGQEHELKWMLRSLERMRPSSAGFASLFAEFAKVVAYHADYEEREEFPGLTARGDAELRGLAVAVKAIEVIAPTHPHPGMESVMSNLLAGSFAAAVDRTRDMVRAAGHRDNGTNQSPGDLDEGDALLGPRRG